MKLIAVLSTILFVPFLAFSKGDHDIVIKTRFDLESSEAFILQLRTFFATNHFPDPYNQVIAKNIEIDIAKLLANLPEDSQQWLQELQSILRLKLFDSELKIVIEKLAYSIEDFNAEFRPGTYSFERIEYVTSNYVRGARLKAQRILFKVELKRREARDPIVFNIALMGPEFLISPQITANVNMGWASSLLADKLRLRIESVDVKELMDVIVKNPHLVDFTIEDMIIPEISVRVGSRQVKFDPDKIKKFIFTKKDELKKSLLDMLNREAGDSFSNIIKDNFQEITLPRTFVFKSLMNAVLDLHHMELNKVGIVQFNIDGHFCENESFEEDYCESRKIPTRPRRKLETPSLERSIREMNRSLIEEKTNIAVSFSEDYVNQVIDATIKQGLWEEVLKGKDFDLGPEGAFILAEEKSRLFSLYLDILYKLHGSDRILIGRSQLRFPIKLLIGLSIQEKNQIPHFLIKVEKIATDEKLILEGMPALGLRSTIASLPRFRKKVLRRIMDEVYAFSGDELVDFEIKELRGTNFDQLRFYSDGLGRGTALIGFKKRN